MPKVIPCQKRGAHAGYGGGDFIGRSSADMLPFLFGSVRDRRTFIVGGQSAGGQATETKTDFPPFWTGQSDLDGCRCIGYLSARIEIMHRALFLFDGSASVDVDHALGGGHS